MQDFQTKQKTTLNEQRSPRTVALFLQSKFYKLEGLWQWELHSDAVYCSDVMLQMPLDVEGTKGIVHPDDLPELIAIISAKEEGVSFSLSFRIITTYGDVKLLDGKGVRLVPGLDDSDSFEVALEQAREAGRQEREQQETGFRKVAQQFAERVIGGGAWYHNASTNKTWYSDQVYRLHGLLPQSLNAHLHTFYSFIHPDDHAAVSEAIDTAIDRRIPLQIEYRIVLPNEEERMVQLNMGCEFSGKGEEIIVGLFQDISEHQSLQSKVETAELHQDFQKQLLQFAEGALQAGYWQIHLVTRKIVLSDNYYRIFGLKPQVVPPSSMVFLNSIHPDDRGLYEGMMRNIKKEHNAPDLEYRIVRPDGKIRFVRQKGRLIVAGDDMIMVGTLQDITVQKSVERKMEEARRGLHIKTFLNQQAETIAGIGSWMWNLQTGEITWSDSFYELLGLKQGVALSQKYLKSVVYPDDQKEFSDALSLAVTERKESEFSFRLISKGVIRHIKAFFRILSVEEQAFLIGTVQDVTAEAEVKKNLTQRIRMIELLSDTMPDQVLVTDVYNCVVLWNKACEHVYGQSKEKALGQNLFDLLPQIKEELVLTNMNMALNGQHIHLKNVQLVPGLKGFYDVSLMPLFDEDHKVIGVLHMIRNVTREHQLHLELTRRLQFIEKLLQATVDRIIVLDHNMNYLYFNQKAEDFYGLNKEGIIGKNILETYPRNQKVPSYAQLREALKGQTVHIPAEESDPYGYYETYLIPIKGQREEVTSVLWIVHNLAKEYELVKEQKKANRLLDSIMELYIELDEDSNLTYVNRQAEERWNKRREELIGKNIWEVFPEAKASGGYQIISRAMAEKTKVQDEYYSTVLKKWVYMSAIPSAEGLVVIFYDITDIKEAREKLEHEHALLKEAQELGHIGSFEWNRASDTVYWSDELYRIHGLEPQSETMTLEKVLSFVDRDFLPETAEQMTRCRIEACTLDFVDGIRWRNGNLRMVRRHILSFADERGEVTHLRGTVQDITGQMEAQKKLEEREALLRTAEEVAFTGSYETDIATMTLRFSDGMFRLFGEAPDSFEPSIEWIDSRTLPSDIAQVKEVMDRAVAAKQPYTYQRRIYRNDGELRILETHGKVVCDANGNAIKLVGLVQDITERKKAEQEIKESKVLAEGIAMVTPDLITIHDAFSNKIIYANNNRFWNTEEDAKQLYGLGDSLWPEAMVHPDDREKAKQFLQDCKQLADGAVVEVELRMQGKIEWVRIRSRVFKRDAQGQSTQIISFTTNITETKNAELEIQKNLTILTHAEDLAQMGSWEYDVATGRFNWSEGMYHLFGLPPGKPVSPDVYLEYAVEEDRSVAKKLIKNLKKQHQPFEDTLRIEKGDDIRTVKIKASVVQNKNGEAQKIIGVDVDVTDILKAEKRLQETRHWLEQTALTSPDSITIYDIIKKEPVYLNDCLANWLETTSEELVRMGIEGRLSMVHPDDRLKLLHFNERTAMGKDNDIQRLEYRIRTHSDKVLWMRNRSKVFQRDASGRVTHLLSILEDVTAETEAERKLLELNESLEQKNKTLENKNDEITSFAFIASHDLKEPLRKCTRSATG